MIKISLIDEDLIEISFPYDPGIIEIVKTIPGRRWNPEKRTWLAPTRSINSILFAFKNLNPVVDEKILKLEKSLKDSDALTVSELNSRINYAIINSFPSPVRVVGEIVDFRKNSLNTPHKFFKLIEKNPEDQSILAEVNISIWENYFSLISKKLASCRKPFLLDDGIEVCFLAEVKFRERGGNISLSAIDIDPGYTIGRLAENREKILAELEAMGLLTKNSSLPLMPFSNRIGIISSLSSDGYNDFISEIKNSKMDFEITAYNVNVQGKLVTKSILSALEFFTNRKDLFDCVVIIRGGGSSTDLAGFDSKELGISVATFPLKIICGIGHERDRTVIDFLTHSVKTPTKAASFLIESLNEDFLKMERTFEKISFVCGSILNNEKERVFHLQSRLTATGAGAFSSIKANMEGMQRLIRNSTGFIIQSMKSDLSNTKLNLKRSTGAIIKAISSYLCNLKSTVDSCHPVQILKKGYTYVTAKSHNGKTTQLRNLKDNVIDKGEELSIHFIDGSVQAKVLKIQN